MDYTRPRPKFYLLRESLGTPEKPDTTLTRGHAVWPNNLWEEMFLAFGHQAPEGKGRDNCPEGPIGRKKPSKGRRPAPLNRHPSRYIGRLWRFRSLWSLLSHRTMMPQAIICGEAWLTSPIVSFPFPLRRRRTKTDDEDRRQQRRRRSHLQGHVRNDPIGGAGIICCDDSSCR